MLAVLTGEALLYGSWRMLGYTRLRRRFGTAHKRYARRTPRWLV